MVKADSVAERFSSWLHGRKECESSKSKRITHKSCTCMQRTLLGYFLPVCMHVESHRPEQFCTVVQKLPFCFQALKLHLVIVPCLGGGEEEKQQYSEMKGGGVYLIRYIYTSSRTDCTLYRGRILKIGPFDFPLFSSI